MFMFFLTQGLIVIGWAASADSIRRIVEGNQIETGVNVLYENVRTSVKNDNPVPYCNFYRSLSQ